MLFCAFSVFAGAIVSAAGAHRDSFAPVLGGRLLMGFGSTIIEIIPQKIYYHWFRGRVRYLYPQSLLSICAEFNLVHKGARIGTWAGYQLGEGHCVDRKGYGCSNEPGWFGLVMGALGKWFKRSATAIVRRVADDGGMTQIPAMICGLNILLTFGYIVWMRTLPEHVRMGRFGWLVTLRGR